MVRNGQTWSETWSDMVWSAVVKDGQIRSTMVKKWSEMVKHGQTHGQKWYGQQWSKMAQYGQTWSKNGQTWSKIVKHGQLKPDRRHRVQRNPGRLRLALNPSPPASGPKEPGPASARPERRPGGSGSRRTQAGIGSPLHRARRHWVQRNPGRNRFALNPGPAASGPEEPGPALPRTEPRPGGIGFRGIRAGIGLQVTRHMRRTRREVRLHREASGRNGPKKGGRFRPSFPGPKE